jgi:hypothetical protein
MRMEWEEKKKISSKQKSHTKKQIHLYKKKKKKKKKSSNKITHQFFNSLRLPTLARQSQTPLHPIASVEQKSLGGWSTLGQREIERVRRQRNQESKN